MSSKKLFARIQQNHRNVAFSDFTRLVCAFGFVLDRRGGGSHRIYKHATNPAARLNLQPDSGEAKPYQVRQFLKLVEDYHLSLDGKAQ